MIDKQFKYLKIGYFSCLATILAAFIIIFINVEKHNPSLSYIGLERWAIIITLCGIFASLKYLNPKIEIEQKDDLKKVLKLYIQKYYLRLIALLTIYCFNLADYIITGSKNFIFLAFICIFALFLCSPNKAQIEIKEDKKSAHEIQ